MKKSELAKLERAKDEAILSDLHNAQEVERLKALLVSAESQQRWMRPKNAEAVEKYLSAKIGAPRTRERKEKGADS